MSLFAELKRRNVFRVGIAYVLMGWVLLQGTDFVLDLIGAPEWVIRVFALAVAVGLPVALFFAWAFELTPDGIKREAEVDRSESIAPTTGRKLDRAIIAFLVLVVVGMGVERLVQREAPETAPPASTDNGSTAAPPAKSIAVLPFADLSQAQDQEWFADGLAEEILNALVKTPDLRVSSRTASFQFKDSEESLASIAAELGVAHILEGSVRSSGDRIRVTAQLIRAADGFHLWSENFDRDVADMISIQEDLAGNIATALETSMDPASLTEMAQVGTRSVAAYQAYLRGVQLELAAFVSDVDPAGFRRAYEQYEQARSLDPGFAEAHARAANYWKVELTPSRTETGSSGLPAPEMFRAYNERIEQAQRTARTEADRIRALADQALMDLRLKESVRLFRQYFELRPNDEQARFELVSAAEMASDRDALLEQLRILKTNGLTDHLAMQGYISEAYKVIDPASAVEYGLKALEQHPNATGLLYQLHRALLWAERFDEAAALVPRLETLTRGSNPMMRARDACARGDRATAENILATLDPKLPNLLSTQWLILNLLGDRAGEAAVLRQLETSGVPYQLASFLTYQQFDPAPFPGLLAILEREGIQRPPPVQPPFQCPPPEETSLAVLPFVNMSADPDNEYFSDGVSEEILNVLAGIPSLKVTARTSAFSFKGSQLKVADIARELGVNHVLEGSVRKAGNEVRVTAQLIKAGDDFHLWSETYDRELDNIFAIQDEIASSIAEQLKVQLKLETDRENFTGTTDTEAYDLFLRGVSLWHERTVDSLRRAIDLFEDAADRDPGFARAYAYLALTWAVIADYTHLDGEQTRHNAAQAARAALALDPNSVEAATALFQTFDDIPRRIEAARDTLAMNSGFATTHQWYASALWLAGEMTAARQEFEQAYALDPKSPVIINNLALLALAVNDLEQVQQWNDELLVIAPRHQWGHELKFLLRLLRGEEDAARQAGQRLARVLGKERDATELYLDVFMKSANADAALAEIMEFPFDNQEEPSNPTLLNVWVMPYALALIGAHEETLRMLVWLKRNKSMHAWSAIRASRHLDAFLCREDVAALLVDSRLPPLPEPPDCRQGDPRE